MTSYVAIDENRGPLKYMSARLLRRDSTSNSSESANSLAYSRTDLLQDPLTPTLAQIVCNGVYFLAKYSTFFGRKLIESPARILLNEDVLFIAAVMLRNLIMLQNVFCSVSLMKRTLCYAYSILVTIIFNMDKIHLKYDEYYGDFRGKCTYGVSVFPFCSLFNHSCDPNANFFTSKINEMVIFAYQDMKKKSQVYKSGFYIWIHLIIVLKFCMTVIEYYTYFVIPAIYFLLWTNIFIQK